MAMVVGYVIAAGVRQDIPIGEQYKALKAIRSLKAIQCDADRGVWRLTVKISDPHTLRRIMVRIDSALTKQEEKAELMGEERGS